ncbi:hypothetical protein BC828DRAFT_397549 [Blastocladiella britannica]|nr:hypothetical protein BC828DRAFT_397549 [Blastocladiella britannica]
MYPQLSLVIAVALLVLLVAGSPVAHSTTATTTVAAAAPTEALSFQPNNNTTARIRPPPVCSWTYIAVPLRVYQRDVPGKFDVGDGFWAGSDQACAQSSLDSGYRGAVYHFDIEFDGDDDITHITESDLVVKPDPKKTFAWYKKFPWCSDCTFMVIGTRTVKTCSE